MVKLCVSVREKDLQKLTRRRSWGVGGKEDGIPNREDRGYKGAVVKNL